MGIKLLAIDIGGGTQDILLYDEDKTLENCIQLVLPSPTRLLAKRIGLATEKRQAVFLTGRVMGGGASVRAVREHLARGLKVYATEESALTFHDDLSRVRSMGIVIQENPPPNAAVFKTGDIDTAMLETVLSAAGEEVPRSFAVAVMDHGFSKEESNRSYRFRLWEKFMSGGGHLHSLAYREAPSWLTRMKAVQETIPGTLVMDTCAAALVGALTDQRVREAAAEGEVALVNVGNQHTFAAIVRKDTVLGLFEDHSSKMTGDKVDSYLERLLAGKLMSPEVLSGGGHGSIPPATACRPSLLVATGPRRAMLEGRGYYFAAPQGNMMLMGCYGLLAAALREA